MSILFISPTGMCRMCQVTVRVKLTFNTVKLNEKNMLLLCKEIGRISDCMHHWHVEQQEESFADSQKLFLCFSFFFCMNLSIQGKTQVILWWKCSVLKHLISSHLYGSFRFVPCLVISTMELLKIVRGKIQYNGANVYILPEVWIAIQLDLILSKSPHFC